MTIAGYPRLIPIFSLAGAAVILVADYVVGPFIQFPVFFLLPVLFASWYGGRNWGLSFAVTLPLIRFYFSTVWTLPWTITESMINALIRITVFSLVAVLADRAAQHERKLEEEVKTLEGLLPICSYCKKIKSDSGKWTVMERYISDHSRAEFSHGICPECLEQHYPEIAKRMPDRED